MKMQKRQQKRDRERLEEARRPFEELNEQYVGFNEATGGIDLMIGGKKKEKAAKVIAIPTDRTYQQGLPFWSKTYRTAMSSGSYLMSTFRPI